MFERRVSIGSLVLCDPEDERAIYLEPAQMAWVESAMVDHGDVEECARCEGPLDADRFCSICGAVTLDAETWVDGSA